MSFEQYIASAKQLESTMLNDVKELKEEKKKALKEGQHSVVRSIESGIDAKESYIKSLRKEIAHLQRLRKAEEKKKAEEKNNIAEDKRKAEEKNKIQVKGKGRR